MHPDPPSLGVLLRAWHPEPAALLAVALAAVLYAGGLWRLRRRGDPWPLRRTLAFGLGLGSVLLATCTGLGRYGMLSFSVHMVQHMVLSMLSPILLLLGAPLTLALRALPVTAGRAGTPRRLLLRVLHSRLVRTLSFAPVAAALFVVSLYGLYFTPLFALAMGSQVGHVLMLGHFLAVGLLFFWPVVGVDPAPGRPSHMFRILMLAASAPFHAFFGISLMYSSSVLGPDRFLAAARSWGWDPLADQATAGAIAWAFTEVPTLLALGVVFLQWSRDDRRAAVRHDRRAARDGDAELGAYNARLAAMARSSVRERG
ncbi:MAG: cytochrome c oxidase assembly protein [Sporichthyaceae bacterium]